MEGIEKSVNYPSRYTLPYLEDFKRYTVGGDRYGGRQPALTSFLIPQGLVAAWLITCCVCDIVISTSVARQLIKSRIGYEAYVSHRILHASSEI